MTGSIEVCRICLASDVRMIKILNTHLQETYEKLTEISLNNEDGRPLYACYMCHALLKKCYNFRMKSLRANSALSELLSNDTEITYKSVQFIDRRKYNLLDGFRITHLEDYNIKSGLIEDDDTVVVKQENVPIKTEEAATDDEYNNTDDTTETKTWLNIEFDGHYKLYSDPEDDVPLNKSDVKKTYTRRTNDWPLSTVVKEEGNPVNRKTRLHMQKKSPDENESQSVAEVQRSSLTSHLRKHNDDKPYVRSNCEYKSVHRYSLLRHLRKNSGDKPYACNICEHKCTDKSNLIRHLRKHSDDKPYACNICEYKCIRKISLISHLKKHSGDKPYACNICEFKCINKSNLIRHLKIHSGEKPYACNICEYKCVQKCHLTTHLRKHSSDKPYACNICEHKCRDKSNFIRHLRKHSNDKPYACHICEYKSIRKDLLITHLKKHSGDVSVEVV